MAKASIFGGKGKSAEPTGARRPTFTPGMYDVQVESVQLKNTRGGDTLFIVEAKILEIHEGPHPLGDDAAGAKRLFVGGPVSYLVSDKGAAADMFPSNCKAFVLQTGYLTEEEIEEMTEDQYEEKFVDDLCGENQPLAGEMFRVTTVEITTKKGTAFPVSEWRPLEDVMGEAA